MENQGIFTIRDMQKILGLKSRRTLTYLFERKILSPSIRESSGMHGSIRLFSYSDLVLCGVYVALTDLGISTSEAQSVVRLEMLQQAAKGEIDSKNLIIFKGKMSAPHNTTDKILKKLATAKYEKISCIVEDDISTVRALINKDFFSMYWWVNIDSIIRETRRAIDKK